PVTSVTGKNRGQLSMVEVIVAASFSEIPEVITEILFRPFRRNTNFSLTIFSLSGLTARKIGGY
ncbi:MAG TPA: hypothetical protein PLT05_06280, partial [bacterium]|nr:hypothetical protein [bacterium]